MRRAGHRIFRHAFSRAEKAADEIVRAAGRAGSRHADLFAERYQRVNIRGQRLYLRLDWQLHQIVAISRHRHRAVNPQRAQQQRGRLHRLRLPRRKVQRQPVTAARDGHLADKARREADFTVRVIEMLENHVRGGNRGVAAEVDFIARGEPAQLEAVVGAHKKRGF